MSPNMIRPLAEKTFNNCTGCGNCELICPKNAIQMKRNDKGFYLPTYEPERCIDCGLCSLTCPAIHTEKQTEKQKVFAAVHKNNEIRAQSASGGAFSAIAQAVLLQKGVIYGAAFDADFHIRHERVEDEKGLAKLRGSKYAQSDLKFCIKELLQDLKSGIPVLFVGTPCQVKAVDLLAQNKHCKNNLFLIDLVCHGVPSGMFFDSHIAFLKQKYGKIAGYRTRSKLQGWHHYFDRIKDENGKIHQWPAPTQAYRQLFASNLCLRESCYACKYASTARVSDITIGDYWGIEKVLPSWDDNKGISLVIVNTEKGNKLLQSASSVLKLHETSLEKSIQKHLYKPCKKPLKTDQFWIDYKNHGYEYIYQHYGKQTPTRLLKRIIRRLQFMLSNKGYHEDV